MTTNKDVFDTTYRKVPGTYIVGKNTDDDTYNILHIDQNGHLFAKMVGDSGLTNVALDCDSNGRLSVNTKLIDELGTSYGVKHVANKPRVSAMPYLYDIAEGNVTGHVSWDKYAINDDVDKAAEEDVWCVGGSYAWLAAETQLVAVSSSAEDDPDKGSAVAGTGVHSVRVYYLDDDFVERTTDVTLNGTAEVALSVANVYRINRIRPLTMGSGNKAAGNIDIKLPAPGTAIYSRIATGYTKGRQLVYTVPTGKALYIVSMSGSSGGTIAPKYAKFTLRSTYDNISNTRQVWMTAYAEKGCSSSNFETIFPCPLYFPAGSDIIVAVSTLDDNTYVTSSLRGWIETI